MQDRRIVIGRCLAVLGGVMAVCGFAVSELAPHAIARPNRHFFAEMAVYSGCTIAIVGLILGSQLRGPISKSKS